jgi:SAM-dependent methyltransferase
MSSTPNIARWASWRPAEYIREYLDRRVEPDEQAAIRFQVAFLRRARTVFQRALEYGCGPTLMRALAAAPYVDSLDMADRLESNLRHVRRWSRCDPGADDWSPFAEYVLRCEGDAAPSRERVLAREARTRRVLSELLATDARRRDPLGPGRSASYDLLLSSFCLDCLSPSKAVWRRCMRNVFGLLRPGGSFVLLALRDCERYRVGDRWFPGANLSRSDLELALLACGAEPAALEVEECDLPSHADQGYRGLIMARGRTADRRS